MGLSERLALSQEASTSGRATSGYQRAALAALQRAQYVHCQSRRRPMQSGSRVVCESAAAHLGAGEDAPLPYTDKSYSQERNAEYWSLRPVTVLKRSLEIGTAFTGWFLDTRVRKGQDPRSISGSQAQRLREVLTELGPAFVKIGQAVSSRPDFVPPSYTRELEKLQDKIPPFSDEEALRIIQEELGQPAFQVYSEFSKTSIAAASLGQVYKAKVRHTGRSVAVKVQRPGVREAIALDVLIMRWLVGKAGIIRKLNSDLPSLLDEWAGSLFRELDYRREARNGSKFKKMYSHLEGIYVPELVHELTTERVLTMEWLEGVRLRSAGDDSAEGRLLNSEDMKLVGFGVQCSLEQMLEDGFYHADPHPGNLLRTSDGRLGYLDFGMMAEIEPKIRRGLILATLHMVNREFQELANDFETLGLLPSGSDKARVVPALSTVFEKALAGGVSNMSFGTLSGDLGRTMYDFKFRIPSYYTLLVRSLSVLEGIALSSDPNYKVLGAAYPWVARRLLTDSNPELRDTLRVLLYKNNRFQFNRLESLLRQALKSPSRPPRGSAQPDHHAEKSAGRPLEFLLGSEGSVVRDLVTDELAKGVDAGWRLATDNALQDARVRLTSILQGDGIWNIPLPSSSDNRQQTSLPLALLTTLNTFPMLADESDSYQVDGIKNLIKVLQEVNGDSKPPPTPSGPAALLPAQVSEAIRMLQWFLDETRSLSPSQRAEALGLPLAVGAKLSSRLAARALKAFLTAGSSPSNGNAIGAAIAVNGRRRQNAAPTRLVNGTLQPAKPPPSQPAVSVGPDQNKPRTNPAADTAVSIPPGSPAATSGLSTEGGGSVAPPRSGASYIAAGPAAPPKGALSADSSGLTVAAAAARRRDGETSKADAVSEAKVAAGLGVGNGNSGGVRVNGDGKSAEGLLKRFDAARK